MRDVLDNYPVVIQQELHWGDMDAFQHVNNKVFFRYFEDVRLAYLEQGGMRKSIEANKVGPVLARTECNFKLPLTYPDTVHIAGRCEILSTKKIKMDYVVYSEKLNRVAAEGDALIVYFDFNIGQSCDIPDDMVAAVGRIEQ